MEAEASSFDVELVEIPSSDKRKQPSGLTRRDFMMFFAGVASVILAYSIGRGLAYLLGPKDRKNEPDSD